MAALGPYFLADKSAIARFSAPEVGARLRPLGHADLVATCAVVDLEVLYSARNLAEYTAIQKGRRLLPSVPITPDVMDRALNVQAMLAQRGQHRLPVTDLIVAAAAESAGLAVLHYDADFGRIAEVTKQKHQWVVPRGSVD